MVQIGMSAEGHSRRFGHWPVTSGLPQTTDIVGPARDRLLAIRECPRRVKLRRTQCEQMSSELPLKADIARCSRHVSKVPDRTCGPQRHCAKRSRETPLPRTVTFATAVVLRQPRRIAVRAKATFLAVQPQRSWPIRCIPIAALPTNQRLDWTRWLEDCWFVG